ncbi:hypothetical protein [Coleofasciculus sp. E1-EBD-02]|uniref:hypothetical protein n=1 Tax=Coleofasciculus sp. E1-EBD-02 TaxID=3068481 RepID=UPI0032F6781B
MLIASLVAPVPTPQEEKMRSLLYLKPETLVGWEFDGLGEGVQYVLRTLSSDRDSFKEVDHD